jgi:hypothetical protein
MIKALRCPSSPMSRIELGQRISSSRPNGEPSNFQRKMRAAGTRSPSNPHEDIHFQNFSFIRTHNTPDLLVIRITDNPVVAHIPEVKVVGFYVELKQRRLPHFSRLSRSGLPACRPRGALLRWPSRYLQKLLKSLTLNGEVAAKTAPAQELSRCGESALHRMRRCSHREHLPIVTLLAVGQAHFSKSARSGAPPAASNVPQRLKARLLCS